MLEQAQAGAQVSHDRPLLLQQLGQHLLLLHGLLLALLELMLKVHLKLVELLWKLFLFSEPQALPKNFLMQPLEESSEILDVHVAEVGQSAGR